MRISIDKSTGRIIEMQTHATPGTLADNAKSSDIKKVEEREVTPEEYHQLLASQIPTPEERRASIIDQIAVLESRQSRALREAALGLGTERLEQLDADIAALRAQL